MKEKTVLKGTDPEQEAGLDQSQLAEKDVLHQKPNLKNLGANAIDLHPDQSADLEVDRDLTEELADLIRKKARESPGIRDPGLDPRVKARSEAVDTVKIGQDLRCLGLLKGREGPGLRTIGKNAIETGLGLETIKNGITEIDLGLEAGIEEDLDRRLGEGQGIGVQDEREWPQIEAEMCLEAAGEEESLCGKCGKMMVEKTLILVILSGVSALGLEVELHDVSTQ